jgi:hypothetical protein
MDITDLKSYTVKVGHGSGVLFQPMNKRDYTYILTAKHNLLGQKDERGQEKKYLLEEIDIFILLHYEEESTKIKLVINESYFPHNDADIAILKINFIEGYEKIYINSSFTELTNTDLCGYPGYLKDKETLEEKYNSTRIDFLKSENKTLCRAQLTDIVAEQKDITGYSGGGIMKIENDNISLFGIQSEVTSHFSKGEIEFVPIKHFVDIINYPENKDRLSHLLPPYMGAFEYLKNEILKLEGASEPSMIGKLKSAFGEQLKLIELNPYEIYNSSLGAKLLADKTSNPFSKELWISWLEYLTILCIIEGKNITIDNLEALFNNKRLIHSDTDSNWIEIIGDLLKNNLQNLDDNGTLIVSTLSTPTSTKNRRYKYDVIEDIFLGRGGRNIGTIQVDQAKNIKSLKEIIHIKAFENDCIMEYEDDFNNIPAVEIEKIILELKNKLNEFFEN